MEIMDLLPISRIEHDQIATHIVDRDRRSRVEIRAVSGRVIGMPVLCAHHLGVANSK